jgi:hypothetical protein
VRRLAARLGAQIEQLLHDFRRAQYARHCVIRLVDDGRWSSGRNREPRSKRQIGMGAWRFG